MYFNIVGKINNIEIIAVGNSIRKLPELRQKYGDVLSISRVNIIILSTFIVDRQLSVTECETLFPLLEKAIFHN